VLGERTLDVTLLCAFGQAKEVEDIRILEHVACEIRLRWRQPVGEIRHGLAGTRVGGRLDLHGQHAARPAVLKRFSRIPEPLRGVVQLVEQRHYVRPR
jgi:hypothetical protein